MASNKFVSRGGDKLQAAIDQFKIDVSGKVALDVGSSTGGFVDCLLQNGADKIFSVDTAYGELAWTLRQNPKVVVMERTNILNLFELPQPVDIVTIDAGWTKLELVLPIIKRFLKGSGQVIALLKPHYEIDQKLLVKGVVPEDQLEAIKQRVHESIQKLGFTISQEMVSPLLGGGGNKEFLLLLNP